MDAHAVTRRLRTLDRYEREERARLPHRHAGAGAPRCSMQRRATRPPASTPPASSAAIAARRSAWSTSELWKRQEAARRRPRIEFLPAINEELAATAVLGTQRVETDPERTVEGVFALWYGKGPGVDRAGDALKHGNAYGSSPHGGVLVVAGDDHGCVSSSMPHQSDVAFMAWPCRRASGERRRVSRVRPVRLGAVALLGQVGRLQGDLGDGRSPARPSTCARRASFDTPRLHAAAGRPALPLARPAGPAIEERLDAKMDAVRAFAEANRSTAHIYDMPDATLRHRHRRQGASRPDGGAAAARSRRSRMPQHGVRHLQGRHGLPARPARRAGVRAGQARDARGRGEARHRREPVQGIFLQLSRPQAGTHGRQERRDRRSRWSPWLGELSPRAAGADRRALAGRRFSRASTSPRAPPRCAARPSASINVAGATRTPYFCSGCPHNTSTKVPEGSQGAGRHRLPLHGELDGPRDRRPDPDGRRRRQLGRLVAVHRRPARLPEPRRRHLLPLRLAGDPPGGRGEGQHHLQDPVQRRGRHDRRPAGRRPDQRRTPSRTGPRRRREAHRVVSDDPGKFPPRAIFPAGIDVPSARGDWTPCSAAARDPRRHGADLRADLRRREAAPAQGGEMVDPKRFAYINDLVCEGCGDCSVESNCVSVEPKETPFGRKRQINLSACNKDFSCLNGFCPSFVTVEGATRRKKSAPASMRLARARRRFRLPARAALDRPYDLLVTGVGGTGVITVGALIGMAAHLEGKGASVLDFMGFAQKGGPVLSYIRLAEVPTRCTRSASTGRGRRADRLRPRGQLLAEGVRHLSPRHARRRQHRGDADRRYRALPRRRSRVPGPPARDPAGHRQRQSRQHRRERAGRAAARRRRLCQHHHAGLCLAARAGAGFAIDALLRAIELNGVAVERNKQAFAWGRIAAADPEFLPKANETPTAETLDQIIARRADFLTAYQDAGLCGALSRTRRKSSCCRSRPQQRGLDRGGRPRPLQADGLQGRVRGRAPAHADRISRRAEARVRGRFQRAVPSRAAVPAVRATTPAAARASARSASGSRCRLRCWRG